MWFIWSLIPQSWANQNLVESILKTGKYLFIYVYQCRSVATCVSWRSEVLHFTPRWPHILAKPLATPRTVYTALQITGIYHNSSKSWVQYKNPEWQSQCKKKISSEKHFQWKEIPLEPDTPMWDQCSNHTSVFGPSLITSPFTLSTSSHVYRTSG